ncbi:LytTR family DNA-binding domain-containing protein [Butyrivibrio sp. INlla16]|uniref:LytR/AlgR family response regulator transcription factor n=1 Tax=Butyrivibrio sp. INlla16 TaxID=1520807 RepID=UPI0008801CB2|nr:LytTR family DNA-binding domain-containing protein [Butyrivibrio sp. INlla16]SDB34050.1 two component transcriptional regulator, LytTR family [Butyrivibrio sp. INlla16]
MYQAAIVEDEEVLLKSTKELLATTFNEKNVDVAFDFFMSGAEFLPMIEQHFHYDIIFLDIEMPGMDGITVCRRIREIAPDALVVFISNKEALVFQTFEVQPFRFIRKSELSQMAPSLVSSIITELEKRKQQIIKIEEPSGGDVYSFDVRTILYVEAQRKECIVVTDGGMTTIRSKLMSLESALENCNFIKIHRSFLVNMSAITRIQKDSVLLKNGHELPLSRNLRETVKQAFLNHSMS